MENSIGKRLKQKINARKLTNKDIGSFINLSPDTVKKLYNYDKIEIDRLIQFCVLLNEDLIDEFYYSEEPMKGFKEKELQHFNEKIEQLQRDNDLYKIQVEQLKDHLNTQKQLIKTQAEYINKLQSNEK